MSVFYYIILVWAVFATATIGGSLFAIIKSFNGIRLYISWFWAVGSIFATLLILGVVDK